MPVTRGGICPRTTFSNLNPLRPYPSKADLTAGSTVSAITLGHFLLLLRQFRKVRPFLWKFICSLKKRLAFWNFRCNVISVSNHLACVVSDIRPQLLEDRIDPFSTFLKILMSYSFVITVNVIITCFKIWCILLITYNLIFIFQGHI